MQNLQLSPSEKQAVLVKTIAILLSVTPETTLGAFLNVCLAAKVQPETGNGTALEMAQKAILDGYNDLLPWINKVIEMDGRYTYEEDDALWKCRTTPELFSDFIVHELYHISYSENMDLDDEIAALIEAIAILLSVSVDTPLGKLFNLCLAAHVKGETSGLNPLDMAKRLIENGSRDMYFWMEEVVFADQDFSQDENDALRKIEESPEMFVDFIQQELEKINI